MTTGPIVFGYHGCDRRIGIRAINNGMDLTPSTKAYDWLGPGVYFWENDQRRAWEWAEAKVQSGAYRNAFVVAAAIELGHCLDLTLRENLDLLAPAYQSIKALNRRSGLSMPENKDPRSKTKRK